MGMMPMLPIQRLEKYSLRHPQEVLLVRAEIVGEAEVAGEANAVIVDEVMVDEVMVDEVMVFKGFSSSLVNPTAFDPDVPVLPEGAVITAIARLRGPYNPQSPEYLEQDVTWATFEQILRQMDL
jgi:hypothetical protein